MTPPFIRIKKDGVTWTTTPEYQFLVESLNGSLSDAEKGEVIKSSSIRRVLAVEVPHAAGKKMEVFVKHHRRLALKEAFKDLIHISKAHNEWRLTSQIAACGVPTVTPLAFGERRRFGFLRESYFVSKRIVACETLHDLVKRESGKTHPPSFAARKREFILRLARLIALIHQKGIDHRDLHAGNILIESNGDLNFYLLDLDRAKIHARLSRRRRMVALSQFAMFFALYVSRADRLRFFKEYYRQDPTPWSGYQEWARRIELKTQKMTNRLYRRRDKGCLEESKHFRRFEVPPYTGHFRKQVVRGTLAELLRNPDKLFRESKAEPLKRSREKTVKRFPLAIHGQTIDVIMKRYSTVGLWGRLKDFLRMSKGKKSWYASNALYQRRIPTALPLACVEEKRFGLVRKSYFFYEFVPHSFVLALYLKHRFAPPLSTSQRRMKRSLARQCAHFVRHLHERGIYHADLKASNILIRENGAGEFEFYLIDLDNVKICSRVNRYPRYRNLMQLNKSFLDRRIMTRTDRLTFLLAYLRFCSRDRRELRRIWNRVSRLTSLRLHKTDKAFTS